MTTLEFDDHKVTTLTLEETARQMLEPTLARNEKIGDVVLDDNDLVVDILFDEPGDPRIHGCRKDSVTITLADIRHDFTTGDYYTWAKDGDGNVLACFGAF